VAGQLGHEALTEPHHLVVCPPLRLEVGSSLSAAHGQRRERVLEHLFERQELEDAKRDAGVKPQAALVGTDGAAHLDAVSAIDVDSPVIVLPGHAEHDDALGLHEAFENSRTAIFRTTRHHQVQALEHLLDRLMELWLRRVAGADLFEDLLNVRRGQAARGNTTDQHHASLDEQVDGADARPDGGGSLYHRPTLNAISSWADPALVFAFSSIR
jgi:hypothetical protein